MVMPTIGRAGRPSPDDHALAASLGPDGVFRVPGRGPAPPVPPRLRRRVAVLAAALAMCAIPAVGIAGLGDGGPPPGAPSDMGAVVQAR
jgi:hypothetical protein